MKIQGADGMPPEYLRDEINRGGRLIVYSYCLSVVVLTLKRPTGVHLVRAGLSPAVRSWPYVLLSLAFGWWGIPWGPIYTVECIYRNLCGGVDVTDEVMAALFPAGAAVAAPRVASPAAPSTGQPGFNRRAAAWMLGGATALAGLGIAAYCLHAQQNLTVVLASGLDQPYRILLNGTPHQLRPHAAEVLALAEGEFTLEDAPGGSVVGRPQVFQFRLPFFAHLTATRMAIINPDRTAVLLRLEVAYLRDGLTPGTDDTPVYELLANQRTYFLPKADYVIEAAPERVSMPSGTRRLVKTRLELHREEDLASLLETMVEKSGAPAAREHLMLRARHRADEALLGAAVRTLPAEELDPFFQLRLAERPVLVEWHRYYQQHMETHHPDHDLVAEYRAALAQEPASGALAYLLSRQLPDNPERAALWRAALAADPPCPYVHHAMAFDAATRGRFEEALAHYEDAKQAGLVTATTTHYRRQLLLALGRAQEILPELAIARRAAPLDLKLADEEIRLTYAVAHDLAAARRLKEAYVAAYQKAVPHATNLADVEAFLEAGIAYASGELTAYAQLVSRFASPFYRFRAALAADQLADAEQALAGSPREASTEFLLFLLAHRQGNPAAADAHFAAALETMRQESPTMRQAAALVAAPQPDATAICALPITIEHKRILLTALGARLPADRSTYFALADRLNFDADFPQQFLRSFLASDAATGAR